MFYLRRTRFLDGRLTVETHTPETVMAAFWRALEAGEIVQLVDVQGKPLKPVLRPRNRRYWPR
jgi:hypothetical protein